MLQAPTEIIDNLINPKSQYTRDLEVSPSPHFTPCLAENELESVWSKGTIVAIIVLCLQCNL